MIFTASNGVVEAPTYAGIHPVKSDIHCKDVVSEVELDLWRLKKVI